MQSIPNPVNLIFLVIGTFLGLSLGLFLLFNKSVKNRANLYLGLLILIISTYFLTGFLFRFDLLALFPHIVGVQHLAGFSIGPLAYFYVRACTQKGFKLTPILGLHFLPLGIDILLNLPFFMQDGQTKVAFYKEFVRVGSLHQSSLMLILKTIQGCIYFGLAGSLILKYRRHLPNMVSSIDKAFHRWLLIFIFIIILPILSLIGFVFTDYHRGLMMISGLGLFSFSLAVYIAVLVKPELFHAFPHQMLIPESSEEKKQKYENSKLQDTQKEKYIHQLKAFVEAEKPFQSPDLTLAQLAEQVKIPAHYVSQVINEKLDSNFLDFINSYRVKAALEMLTDTKLSHYTIMAIAYDAGFNAKSTFYAAFKKHTGMTPSAYRKEKLAA